MANEWDRFPAASPLDVALQAEGLTGSAAAVARSIYEQESSSGKNSKTSNAGAVGGMQVMPGTFKEVADPDMDINDPVDNARAGVRYVKKMHDRADGDVKLAAVGYYGGPGGQDKAKRGEAVKDPRNPNAPDTLEYAQQVTARIPKGAASAPAAPPLAAPTAQADNWDAFPVVEAAPAAPPKARRTALAELGRQLGLTLRAGAKGVATVPGLVVDAVTGPINAAADAVAGEGRGPRIPTTVQAVDNLLTAAGVAEPENATERVVQDVGSGMAGAGGMVKGGQLLAKAAGPTTQAVGKLLAAGPGLQVASGAAGAGASGVVREEGGGTGAQVAAGLAGALAPGFAGPAVNAAARGVLRGGEAGRARVEKNIELFGKVGATPSLGQATEGRVQRALESGLAQAPGSAGVMRKFADKQLEDMANAVQKASDELAPGASGVNAGEAIARGVRTFKDGMKALQQRLYTDLDQHLPANTPIAVQRTQAELAALNADIPGAPNISEFFKNAKIKGIDRALQADLDAAVAAGAAGQTGTLPYEAIKKLRTLVGNEIADHSLVSDVPRSKWTALYGALSDDLGTAAKQAGPKAEQSWQWANTYTRTQLERLEQLKNIVAKDSPEKVFTAAVSNTAEGDTIVRRVINALPKAERREVAAAVLQRMGRSTPGQQNAAGDAFSSETFLTNLSKLSPAARKTLFGRTDVAGIQEQVASFGQVAENLRQGSKVFANPSGTAQALSLKQTLGGAGVAALTGNPGIAAATIAAPGFANMAARAATSPALVGYAAKSTGLAPGTAATVVNAAGTAGADMIQPDAASEWDQFPPVDAAPGEAPVVPADPAAARPGNAASPQPMQEADPELVPLDMQAPNVEPEVTEPPMPPPLDQEARIQLLRDAGDDTVADMLQSRLKQQQLEEATTQELTGFAEAAPDDPFHSAPAFQAAYKEMRGTGAKPGEAAARAGMLHGLTDLVASSGLPEKVIAAARQKADTMPLDKVPGFLEKFIAGLSTRGLGQALQPGAVEQAIAAARDRAVDTVLASVYRPAPAAQTPAPMSPLFEAAEPAPMLDAPAEVTTDETMAADSSLSQEPELEFASEPRPDGTLMLKGDAKAIRDTLVAAGVPPTSLMLAQDGVRVGRTQVAAVQQAIERMNAAADLEDAAHEAATSPLNDLPEPSEAQQMAGNYRKGHMKLHGLDISIENPKGSVRRGVDPDGNEWESELASHYGYIRKTKGNDGDHVDVFVGPQPESRKVFVVDQLDKDGGFDEHKVLLGFDTREAAEEGYLQNYAEGWDGMGAITELPLAAFKAWVASGTLKEPLSDLPEKPQVETTTVATPDFEPAPAATEAPVQPAEGSAAVADAADAQGADAALMAVPETEEQAVAA